MGVLKMESSGQQWQGRVEGGGMSVAVVGDVAVGRALHGDQVVVVVVKAE